MPSSASAHNVRVDTYKPLLAQDNTYMKELRNRPTQWFAISCMITYSDQDDNVHDLCHGIQTSLLEDESER